MLFPKSEESNSRLFPERHSGEFEITSLPAYDAAEVTLKNISATPPSHKLRLSRIAKLGMIRRHDGVRIGNWGKRLKYQASFPVLDETASFFAAINERLRAEIKNDSAAWGKLTFANWLENLRYPSAVNAGECNVTYKIIFFSPEFVSLIATRYEYSGRAHGNTWFQSYNFVADDRRVFSVDANGLTFYFAPYEVGYYAEGSYEATVPFELIQDILRRDKLITSTFALNANSQSLSFSRPSSFVLIIFAV